MWLCLFIGHRVWLYPNGGIFVLAIILLTTAVTGWCPMFDLLGIDHQKRQESD
ncbi:MAG: hypothetical protein BRD50_09470 [Bacteroidetes bacterium SW_11_45_7]|nr:MAG: hypothetical protein BRD50_09470 [Bacteroidetes bacterium SW_11_45_7]